jgi:hypothetical protein
MIGWPCPSTLCLEHIVRRSVSILVAQWLIGVDDRDWKRADRDDLVVV